MERLEASSALRNAVQCLDELRSLLKKAERGAQGDAAALEALVGKVDEASAVARALAMEIRPASRTREVA